MVSTASAFRYEPDVPIFIPGVNLDHDRLIAVQKKTRGWNGFVTPVPNCTTTGLAMTLKPIHDAFGIARVIMTSMQGLSGAGRSPGVIALDIVDNVVPFVPKEEEKVEVETRKILGIRGRRHHRAGRLPGLRDVHAGAGARGPHRGGVRLDRSGAPAWPR